MKHMPGRVYVGTAFREAFKGFKGWWIPLCLISGTLLLSQSWLPGHLLSQLDECRYFIPLTASYAKLERNLISLKTLSNPSQAREAAEDFRDEFTSFFAKPETGRAIRSMEIKMAWIFLGLLTFVSLLHVSIILVSKASVWRRKEEVALAKDFKRSGQLSLSYMFLTLVKLAPFAASALPFILWLHLRIAGMTGMDSNVAPIGRLSAELAFCAAFFAGSILFGLFIYVKLFFTCFLITERRVNPFQAMLESWRMCQGNFMAVSMIFLVNLAIDAFSTATIVGFIPGTAMNYTLRASAYQQARSGVE